MFISLRNDYFIGMETSAATSTDFYAGVNQPAAGAYMWAPLIVLSVGMLVLVFALAWLARAEQRDIAETNRSFFD